MKSNYLFQHEANVKAEQDVPERMTGHYNFHLPMKTNVQRGNWTGYKSQDCLNVYQYLYMCVCVVCVRACVRVCVCVCGVCVVCMYFIVSNNSKCKFM